MLEFYCSCNLWGWRGLQSPNSCQSPEGQIHESWEHIPACAIGRPPLCALPCCPPWPAARWQALLPGALVEAFTMVVSYCFVELFMNG